MKTIHMRIDDNKPSASARWDKVRGKLDPSKMGYLIADPKTGELLERVLYLQIEQARTRRGMVISRSWWEKQHNIKIKTTKSALTK